MRMPNALHCSWLLELPDTQAEYRFWADEDTLRTYSSWDFYICINMIVSNLMLAKAMWRALTDVSALPYTWHIHMIVLTNVAVCTMMLVLMRRHYALYKQHRRALATMSRLLRFGFMIVAVFQSSNALQAALARAVNAEQPQTHGHPQLRFAALSLLRPLFMAPIITMAHGSWVIEAKYWLPLQLMTAVMGAMGAQRHQHCRLAAEVNSALLLQPVCRGMSTVHQYMASVILGPAVLAGRGPFSSIQDPAACSTMTSSARTLVWYTQLLYGLLMPAAGFCRLEWRLKAKFVHEKLGKQLVYGPWGWPRSCSAPSTFGSVLQSCLGWLLFIIVALAAVWCVSLWLVPRLALLPCDTCADKGTCKEVARCEGGPPCDDPGFIIAAIMHLQALFILLGHLAVTRVV